MATKISEIRPEDHARPGIIALFGSGETSASGRRVFEQLFKQLPLPIQVSILETPAGFELNSTWVAAQVGEFLQHRLRNYAPEVHLLPARRKNTSESPDNPAILGPLFSASLIYLGAGSPTYAVRQLKNSLAWHILQGRHRLGSMVVLASASTLSVGAFTLPVYEMYKVGEDPHWKEGLDLFGPFGLKLVFVPHWNNTDGGEVLDTSRCYIGKERFDPLYRLLPEGVTVIGIEEHSAIIFHLDRGVCEIVGRDGVVVLQDGTEQHFAPGASFSLDMLGSLHFPVIGDGLPGEVVHQVLQASANVEAAPVTPDDAVLALVEQRRAARLARDWRLSDQIRDQLLKRGWKVQDTQNGQEIAPI